MTSAAFTAKTSGAYVAVAAQRVLCIFEEFGLIIDTPRASGSGNSNMGNTARCAFQNEEKYGEILCIDPIRIHRIHVLLIAINADIALNADTFRIYASLSNRLHHSRRDSH